MARKRPGHKGLSGEDDSDLDAYDVATPYAPPAVDYAPVQIPALDSLDAAEQDQVLNAIAAGIANGDNPYSLVSALSDILNASQALTILRTEMLGAYRNSALDSYRDNSDVIGSWMWVATLSPNTCIACLETDGEIFSLDENFDEHPNGRCTPVPVTIPWSGILGPLGIDYSDLMATSIDQQDFMSGTGWFITQDAAVQREILGPSAFNAWQAGELQLSDLAERDAEGQLYQASLSDLGIDWRDFRDSQMIDLTEWNATHGDDNLLGLASRPGGGVEPMRRAFEELPNLDGITAQLADRHEGLEAELAGLDTPVANQLAATFDRIAERWPEAAERVGYFGVDIGPGAERVLRGPQSLPWRMFAAADPNGRYVLLNAARFYDIEKVQAELAEDVATHFHPLGADNPMFPVAHEMGHVVDAWIRTDAERAALLDAWEAEHGALAGGLGRYVNGGDFVEHERFATAFAANELGILADDPYVRAQAEFLQQLIADHPGTGDAVAFPGKGSDLRPIQQEITRASLEKKSMPELREIARDVGANPARSKAETIDRILAKSPASAAETTAAAKEPLTPLGDLRAKADVTTIGARDILYSLADGTKVGVTANADGTFTVLYQDGPNGKLGPLKLGGGKNYKTLQGVNKLLRSLRIGNVYDFSDD